jgi:hypothetical protein
MPTNREIVTRIESGLNLLSKDTGKKSRLILRTAQNVAESYIAKRLRTRSLFRQDSLYKEVSCVELIDVDIFQCDIVEFKSCNKLKRSKKKLPDLVYSRYGPSIQEVTAIDNIYDFKLSTLAQYRIDKRRKGHPGVEYFYVKDGYLWIPDSEVRRVNIRALALDQYDFHNLSECDKSCMSVWDYEFTVPSDILEGVIEETTQKIARFLNIPVDEKPNMDSNQKSQTV